MMSQELVQDGDPVHLLVARVTGSQDLQLLDSKGRPGHSRHLGSVVLSGVILLPEDIWQCLETLLVLTTGEWVLLESREEWARKAAKHTIDQELPSPKSP